jgi:hypothetical protein
LSIYFSVCLSVYISIYLSICLYIYLSVCVSVIYLSIYLSICLYIYLSIYLSVYLSIYLSICLSIYLSICLSICLYIFLSVYLCICLSIHLSVCLFVYIYIYIYICLSICPYIYLSVCLFIYLSIYLPIYLSIYLSVCLSVYLSILFRSGSRKICLLFRFSDLNLICMFLVTNQSAPPSSFDHPNCHERRNKESFDNLGIIVSIIEMGFLGFVVRSHHRVFPEGTNINLSTIQRCRDAVREGAIPRNSHRNSNRRAMVLKSTNEQSRLLRECINRLSLSSFTELIIHSSYIVLCLYTNLLTFLFVLLVSSISGLIFFFRYSTFSLKFFVVSLAMIR